MKEVFKQIIERLQKLESRAEQNMNYYEELSQEDDSCKILADESKKEYEAFCEANSIVTQVAEEYSDGWIPVSSGKLPEEQESVFAKFKGTDKWNNSMFEKISNVVNVTVEDEKGGTITTHAHTVDGNWSCDLLRCNKSYRIIAWMELPKPYQSRENSEISKQTNFDNIKDMTVEEMAKMLDEYAFCHARTVCPYLNNNDMNCIQCITKWLQSEVEET